MLDVRLALVQVESALGNVDANVALHARWIERAQGADAELVCFPECSLTGYSTEKAREGAIDARHDACARIERYAFERGMALGYGFAERELDTGALFIAYVVSSAEGSLVYRKTHLGSHERAVFAAGDDLPTAQVKGVRVGVQLCWEAHIPDISSTLRARGAELVVVPHAGGLGGARRIASWDRYLAARALDNGLFVASCNALRRDASGCVAGGGMAVYAPDGRRIACDSSSDPGMLVVDAGGPLPREGVDDSMHAISYFDRRRPELYA